MFSFVCKSACSDVVMLGVFRVVMGMCDPLDALVGSVEVEFGREVRSMGTVEAVEEKKLEAVELDRLSR